MDNRDARPVFVVGSPRSGTSILTWALGQHPNILPVEEGPGRGPFAVAVGVYFATGNRRGPRSQLSSLGVERDAFFREFGDAIDRQVLDHRWTFEQRNLASAIADPAQINERFAISRGAHEPKRRWVDGTPESSFYICGLSRLFPQAKFVHILRDVREVAASMLGFRNDDGSSLVRTAEAACGYWLRATQACDLAQRALGPETVHRLQYADLVAQPEAALRDVCEFLGEAFAPACLEPLAERINSSRVDNVDAFTEKARTPIIDAALALSDRLCGRAAQTAVCAGARAEMEAEFENMVEHAGNVDAYHETARQVLDRIERILDEGSDINEFPRILAENQSEMDKALAHSRRAVAVCGIVLAVQWIAALAVWISTRTHLAGFAFGIASAAIVIYVWLRRIGLRAAWRRLVGKHAVVVKEQT